MQRISVMFVISVAALTMSATPVFAQGVPPSAREARREMQEARKEYREEVRETRKNLLEELKNKFASREGFLRGFLGKRAHLVRGIISAISGTTLTVDKDGKSLTVLTGTFEKCTTKLKRRFWGNSAISEMSVGDTVNIFGFWQDEARTTIEACLVRDLSIQKRFGVFIGEVKQLTGTGWVMSTLSASRPDQTVIVSSSTKFVNRKEEMIAQADIKVGHRVRVKGLWNRETNTVTEVIHVKDYSLPTPPTGGSVPTVTATVSPTP